MIKETSVFNKLIETGKHGIIFGIGSSLTTALGFFLIPIYTTHFSAAEYGTFGLIVITGLLRLQIIRCTQSISICIRNWAAL